MPNCKTVVPYRGSPEQEERLRQVIAEHRGQPGATMPVLQAAQEIFGYLPEEVQIMVAEGLDIPLSEVYGVASFYAQFSMNPKGKYQIPMGSAGMISPSSSPMWPVSWRMNIGRSISRTFSISLTVPFWRSTMSSTSEYSLRQPPPSASPTP